MHHTLAVLCTGSGRSLYRYFTHDRTSRLVERSMEKGSGSMYRDAMMVVHRTRIHIAPDTMVWGKQSGSWHLAQRLSPRRGEGDRGSLTPPHSNGTCPHPTNTQQVFRTGHQGPTTFKQIWCGGGEQAQKAPVSLHSFTHPP